MVYISAAKHKTVECVFYVNAEMCFEFMMIAFKFLLRCCCCRLHSRRYWVLCCTMDKWFAFHTSTSIKWKNTSEKKKLKLESNVNDDEQNEHYTKHNSFDDKCNQLQHQQQNLVYIPLLTHFYAGITWKWIHFI